MLKYICPPPPVIKLKCLFRFSSPWRRSKHFAKDCKSSYCLNFEIAGLRNPPNILLEQSVHWRISPEGTYHENSEAKTRARFGQQLAFFFTFFFTVAVVIWWPPISNSDTLGDGRKWLKMTFCQKRGKQLSDKKTHKIHNFLSTEHRFNRLWRPMGPFFSLEDWTQ